MWKAGRLSETEQLCGLLPEMPRPGGLPGQHRPLHAVPAWLAAGGPIDCPAYAPPEPQFAAAFSSDSVSAQRTDRHQARVCCTLPHAPILTKLYHLAYLWA